jgi:GTP pyrophosphokinase
MVPLKAVLQNGDRVEVLTRPDHKPSRDWLALVKSAGAKSRIHAFIREEERKVAIAMGRDRLEREARTAGVNLDTHEAKEVLEARLKEIKQPSWDAFFAAVGFNRITVHKLLEPLLPEKARTRSAEKPQKTAMDAVLVDDNVGILFHLAHCCKPIWGDEIVGYTTRSRGIAIHHADCPQLHSKTLHPERRVPVGWGVQGQMSFDTELALTTEDRPGMVAAISEAMQKASINIQRFNASTLDEGAGLFHVALRVRHREHLVELIGLLRRVRGVYTVERVRGSVFGKLR